MNTIKRRSALFILGIVVIALPGVATAQTAADTAALHKRVEAYQSAWNTHDPAAVAAFFSADADFVMGAWPPARGRLAIQKQWRSYFAHQEPGRRLTLKVDPVRFVTADIAVLNVATTTGGRDRTGQELPARKFRGTWVLCRRNGSWLISAMLGLPTEEDRVELKPSLEAAQSLRPHLRAFVAAYEDTFNQHDPDALSAFYRDDADIIVRNGPVIHGAEAVRQWWRDYFSQPRRYRALLIINEIKMMSDDAAFLDITATGAMAGAGDQLQPVRRARARWIVAREDGDWRIAALRVLPSEDDRIIREHEQGR